MEYAVSINIFNWNKSNAIENAVENHPLTRRNVDNSTCSEHRINPRGIG